MNNVRAKPIVGIDSETELVRQGVLAPPLVCVSTCLDDNRSGRRTRLTHWSEAKPQVAELLGQAASGRIILLGHRIAYDMAVFIAMWSDLIPLVIAAYDADGIADTRIRERLLDIAEGKLAKTGEKYSLAALSKAYLDIALDKGADSWQLRYAELRHLPIDQWPEAAQIYPQQDAAVLPGIYDQQELRSMEIETAGGFDSDLFVDQFRQTRKAFALHVMACRGLEVDIPRAQDLMIRLTCEQEMRAQELKACGLLGAKGAVSSARTREILRSAGDPFADDSEREVTETGQLSTRADILLASGDPNLRKLVEYRRNTKRRTTYLEPLIHWGSRGSLLPNVETLVETGRTSMPGGWVGCYSPERKRGKGFSLQTMPRDGGIRDCFVPRYGYEFAAADYSVAEMRSLGQAMLSLLGRSPLADFFRADPRGDCHIALAAQFLGISLDEAKSRKKAGDQAIKDARQNAKAPNFGFPGGMGVTRFVANEAKKFHESGGSQGKLWRFDEANIARNGFIARWGMQPYFDFIAGLVDDWDGGTIKQIYSDRYRARCGYSDACNGFFQSLTADGAGLALWNIAKACLVGELRGCAMVLFTHDDNVLEVPKGAGKEALAVLERIMIDSMQTVTPDVPAAVDGEIKMNLAKGG